MSSTAQRIDKFYRNEIQLNVRLGLEDHGSKPRTIAQYLLYEPNAIRKFGVKQVRRHCNN